MAVLSPTAGSAVARGPAPRLLRRLALAALLLAAPLHSAAQPAAARADQVKAVFLFNFAQFVEWPADAFASADAPLVIGVLGHDPFGPLLDEVVRGESVGGRSLAIRRYRQPEEVGVCHILYIGRSETARLGQLLARLQGRRVLTVSDIEGAAQQGVMIRFVTENKRIRLRINLDAVRAERLVISSKLLRPADIVSSQTGAPP